MRNVFGFAGGMRLGNVIVVALAAAIAGCSGSDGSQPGTGAPAAAEPNSPNAATPSGETPATTSSSTPAQNTPPANTPPANTPPAETAPTVVSTAPANAAMGVKGDTKIVVKFDHPMDTASVNAAYVSLELPHDQVAFSWNASEDEITITPNAPLAYSAGGPDVGAYGFGVGFTTAAKAKNGIALAEHFSIGFSTLRRITAVAPMKSTLSGRVMSNGTFTSLVAGAGDVWFNGAELTSRALFTFDLVDIPETGIEVESATVAMTDSSYTGTPDVGLGQLAAHHVFYTVGGADAYSAEPMAGVGVTLVIGAPNSRKATVTDMVKEDLANRVVRLNRSQYRLAYPTGVSGDSATDVVMFDKQSANLSIVYLAN